MTDKVRDLNVAIGRALGMPPMCYRLVLTLERGKFPTVLYECHMTHPVTGAVELTPDHEAIKSLSFMVRLEPFPEIAA